MNVFYEGYAKLDSKAFNVVSAGGDLLNIKLSILQEYKFLRHENSQEHFLPIV